MARDGQNFDASHRGLAEIMNQSDFLSQDKFDIEAITADWEVTFKREPRVIWVNEYIGNYRTMYESKEKALENKHNDYSCIKTIKFIEVLEE
jgi:hypothetical protein